MTSDFYENEKFSDEEKDINSKQAFMKLWPFLRQHSKRLIAALILLGGATLLSLVWPFLLKDGIDGPLRDNDMTGLIYIAAAIAVIQIVTLVVQYFMRIKLEIIGQDLIIELKQKLFDHVLSLDISYFDKNPVGRLMARIESDCEALRLMFTNTVVLIVADLLLLIGIYAILFYTNWKMALVLLISIPILAVLIWILHKMTTHRFLELRKQMAELTATLTEFLHSMSIVQIFHRGSYAREKVEKANQLKFKQDSYIHVSFTIFFNLIFLMEYIKIGMVLILGPAFGLSFGAMVMFLLYIWKSTEPIFRTSEQLSNFQKAIAGAKRIFALLAQIPKLSDPIRPVDWDGIKKEIRFENVWFSYTDDENYVLKDVSFVLPVGKRVAIAGVTGGGKSTIISLILRLYDPQKGKITIDGIDIRDIRIAELRKRFALVLQDIFLFPGDVKSNISLESDSVSDDQIVKAAATVEADRFINRLPDKYDTKVSEKGSNFSRGERQLLSFARALAIDPEVLILDEATSSVDPETERTIQSSLKKLMTGRTSLIIAHRLATILDVDQILVLRRGEIIERGTHTDLILKEGYYSKLFHLQFKHRNGAILNA